MKAECTHVRTSACERCVVYSGTYSIYNKCSVVWATILVALRKYYFSLYRCPRPEYFITHCWSDETAVAIIHARII